MENHEASLSFGHRLWAATKVYAVVVVGAMLICALVVAPTARYGISIASVIALLLCIFVLGESFGPPHGPSGKKLSQFDFDEHRDDLAHRVGETRSRVK
jgi:hypothetical protein